MARFPDEAPFSLADMKLFLPKEEELELISLTRKALQKRIDRLNEREKVLKNGVI